MAMETDDKADFSARMAAVFGALGGDSGLASGWQVSEAEAVFKRGDCGSDEDLAGGSDSDGEGEGGPDAQVDGGEEEVEEEDALGEEEEDVRFRKSASVAFCSGLDREREMDEYDNIATGSMTAAAVSCPEARPPGDTEVLEGNYYENRCARREGKAAATAGEPPNSFLAVERERCQAAVQGVVEAPHCLGAEPRRWNFQSSTDPEKPLGATHSGSGDHIRWTAAVGEGKGDEVMGTEGGVGARRGGEPVVWSSGKGGEGSGGEGSVGQGQPQTNPTQGKEKRMRVRFADDVVEREEERRSTGRERSFPRGGRGGGRSAMRRGNRQSRVPDHVRNPDKWTCYTLDEPITVGGGGGGDTTAGLETLQAPQPHRATDAAHHQGEEEVREALPPPGQGIKFVPRKDRGKAAASVAGQSASSTKPKKVKRGVVGALACAADVDDAAEVMEIDEGDEGEDAPEPVAPSNKLNEGRRFRGT